MRREEQGGSAGYRAGRVLVLAETRSIERDAKTGPEDVGTCREKQRVRPVQTKRVVGMQSHFLFAEGIHARTSTLRGKVKQGCPQCRDKSKWQLFDVTFSHARAETAACGTHTHLQENTEIDSVTPSRSSSDPNGALDGTFVSFFCSGSVSGLSFRENVSWRRCACERSKQIYCASEDSRFRG